MNAQRCELLKKDHIVSFVQTLLMSLPTYEQRFNLQLIKVKAVYFSKELKRKFSHQASATLLANTGSISLPKMNSKGR